MQRLLQRLVALPLPFKRLPQLLWPLLTALLGVLLGFHLFFPDAALTGWLQSRAQRQLPAGATLTVRHGTLAFPLRLALDDLELLNDKAGWPPLRLQRLALMPTWSTLLGSPGVRFSGNGPLGTFTGFFQHDGEVAFDLRDGTLALTLPQQSQLQLDGTLNRLQLAGRLPVGPQSTLQVRAAAGNLVLHGVKRFGLADDALALGHLQLQVEGAGRSLQLRELQLAGGVAELQASGELLLQPTLPASRVDLSLQLRPAANIDPALRGLLELAGAPEADGSYLWRLRGSLAAPKLN